MLRKTSEASALNQARHADRSAAAALHVRAAFCRHRVVRLHPNRAEADRHRALRGVLALASMWTYVSCIVMSCMRRVHTSSESAAFEVP